MKLFPHLVNLLFLVIFFLAIKSDAAAAGKEEGINLKVVPQSHLVLQQQDIDRLRMEIEHDINKEISNLEESWAAKQRQKEKSAAAWNLHGAPVFIPHQYSSSYLQNQVAKAADRITKGSGGGGGMSESLANKFDKQLKAANQAVRQLNELVQDSKKNK
jgi:hypothetical protein